MADFELLSTYITIRTRGLQNVLRDFARARESARRASRVPIDQNMRRAAGAAQNFRDFVASSAISFQRVNRSTQEAAARIARLAAIQQRLEQRLAAGNLSVQQRAALESRITSVARRRLQLESSIAAQAARLDRQKVQSARQAEIAERRRIAAIARAERAQALAERQRLAAITRAERAQAIADRQRLAAIQRTARLQAQITNAQRRASSAVQLRNAAAAAQRFAFHIRSAQLGMSGIAASGATAQQQIASLARIQQRLSALQQRGNLNQQQQLQLQRQINQVLGQQQRLQAQITNAQRRATAAGLASIQRTANAIAAQRARIAQALNSVSLEAGFIAPFTRLGGNVLRIAQGFRSLASAAGLSAVAIRRAGIAGVVFALGLKGIQIALNLAAAALRVMARVALPAIRGAFQTLFGPTLAFLRLVRQLIQHLPLLATVIGTVLTRSLIRTAAQFQRITSGFEFAFGANAQGELSRVISLANRLGIPLDSITENYVRISAAARDAGIAQEDVRQLVQGVGSAAIALGLDVERVNGLFFAFEQVISKGRLAAEELRRQIGDRLPGAFAIAARAMGVTTAELDQMLEQGAINSVDFIRAIGSELNRTFGGTAVRQADRLTATMNRLSNQWKLLRIDLATRLEPAFVRIIQRITELIASVRNSAAFQAFTRFISGQLFVLEANFNRVVGSIRSVINQLAPTFQRLGRLILVLNTISIGGIVEAVRRLQPTLDAIIVRIENFVTGLTGISFQGLGLNLQSVIALAEALPLIFDAIVLRIRLAFERFRQFLAFVTDGFSSASSFILRAIGGAISQALGVLSSAYSKVQKDTAVATSMARELELRWQTIAFVIQNSLKETAVKRFEMAVLSLTKRFLPLQAGAVGFFSAIFGGVNQLNEAVRQALGLQTPSSFGEKAREGTASIVDITQLRDVLEQSGTDPQQEVIASATQGTQANTRTIAKYVELLDTKLAKFSPLVETLLRESVLLLPGGGLSR